MLTKGDAVSRGESRHFARSNIQAGTSTHRSAAEPLNVQRKSENCLYHCIRGRMRVAHPRGGRQGRWRRLPLHVERLRPRRWVEVPAWMFDRREVPLIRRG